jgi:tRNA(fMet)-specific endonuclease VapC
LLDTNTVSHLIRGNPRVLARLPTNLGDQVVISVVTEAELLYGLEKHPEAIRLRRAVEEFLGQTAVLPWTSRSAAAYGRLRASLERIGRPLGTLDTLIAAQAIEHGLLLVTNDHAFGQVPDLAVEDWTA